MKKKIFSIVLSAVMIITALPVMVFADELVAQIGDNKYGTLQAAIDAASSVDTVVLLKDLLNRSGKNEASVVDKDITLDLNGHKIVGNYTNGGVINTYGNSSSKTAHLTITDNSDNKGGSLENTNTGSTGCGVYQDGYSVLTLTNVTVKGAYAGIIQSTYYASDNQLTVGEGASVTGTSYAGVNISSDRNSGSGVIVDGGTISGGYRGVMLGNSGASLTMNSGSITGTSWGIVASKNNCEIEINDGTVIGTDNYGIQAGTLSSNSGLKVTINKGTVSGGEDGIHIGGKNSTATINGGLVSGADYGIYVGGVTSGTPNSVTVSGGAVQLNGNKEGESAIGLWNGAKLIMTSGEVVSRVTGFAIANNGSNTVVTSIDISGGTVSANVPSSTAIYQAGPGTTTISGIASITGYDAGIEVRNGTLNVSGGTITSTSDTFSCIANDDGTTTVGSALAIAQHTTKKDITVNITGGTFKGVIPVHESNPQGNDPVPQVNLTVTGGDFWSTDVNENQKVFSCMDCKKFISDGFFSSLIENKYIEPGYQCITTNEEEKLQHNNLSYKIGEPKTSGTVVITETDNDVPKYYENENNLQYAIDNITEANQEKASNNETVTVSTIIVTNTTGINAEIDDKVVVVAKTGAGIVNTVSADPGYILESPVENESEGTITYTASELKISYGDKEGTITGSGITETKQTDAKPLTPSIPVTTTVQAIAANVSEQAETTTVIQTVASEVAININQGTAAKALAQGTSLVIKNTTDAATQIAAKDISVFVDTYYQTQVTEDKTEEPTPAQQSFTLDIKPMYQAYATTIVVSDATTMAEITPTIGTSSAKIGSPKELDMTGKTVTMKVKLPEGFVSSESDRVYVMHTKDANTKKYYTATVSKESEDFFAVFTNPDGFSEFTFSRTSLEPAPPTPPAGGGSTPVVKKACPQDETCVYAKFTDANTKEWYHDGVHFCVEKGYMIGVDTDRFAPADNLSRAMIVTMLWRMEGSPVVNYAMSFKDVGSYEWYTEAVRWAQSTKIVEGYSSKAFGPEDNVTREQVATILNRYAAYKGISVSRKADLAKYTDVKSISDWALDSIKWANAVGIINGRTDTTIVPGGESSRAEAACMFQRFCESILK